MTKVKKFELANSWVHGYLFYETPWAELTYKEKLDIVKMYEPLD